MIRILILDDDPAKLERIRACILTRPEVRAEDILTARDLVAGRDFLRQRVFDLLILDLILPTRLGDPPDKTAGREFLKELEESRTLTKPFHIIGLTAFEEAKQLADSIFAESLWGLLIYDQSSNAWENQLLRKVQHLVNSKKALRDNIGCEFSFDLAIVTALHAPELRSVLALPADWREEKLPNDSTTYHAGRFRNEEHSLSVVAAAAPQMGMPAAAVLSMKLIGWYRPRFIVACGIAAGFSGADVNLGDLLLADQSWDYESGKKKPGSLGEDFLPDPKFIPLSADLRDAFGELQRKGAYLEQIAATWSGTRPESTPAIRIGPVASGSSVVEDERVYKKISMQSRKVIGLEMETYGVFYAAENCAKPRPVPFSVKCVCDCADSAKSDTYQEYAAYMSAWFLYRFALGCLR